MSRALTLPLSWREVSLVYHLLNKNNPKNLPYNGNIGMAIFYFLRVLRQIVVIMFGKAGLEPVMWEHELSESGFGRILGLI